MSPSGRKPRMTLERGGASMAWRRVPTGTLPSSPTRMRVWRLQTKGHQGQAGAGRRTERFSMMACGLAAAGVVPSSRWISCWLAWVSN